MNIQFRTSAVRLVLCCAVSALLLGACSSSGGEDVDFASGRIPSGWVWANGDPTSVSLTARPGWLRITTFGDEGEPVTPKTRNVLFREMPEGDFDFQARLEPDVPGPDIGNLQCGVLFASGDKCLKLVLLRNQLEFTLCQNGHWVPSNTAHKGQKLATRTGAITLRLTRRAGSIAAYWRNSDSDEWQTLQSSFKDDWTANAGRIGIASYFPAAIQAPRFTDFSQLRFQHPTPVAEEAASTPAVASTEARPAEQAKWGYFQIRFMALLLMATLYLYITVPITLYRPYRMIASLGNRGHGHREIFYAPNRSCGSQPTIHSHVRHVKCRSFTKLGLSAGLAAICSCSMLACRQQTVPPTNSVLPAPLTPDKWEPIALFNFSSSRSSPYMDGPWTFSQERLILSDPAGNPSRFHIGQTQLASDASAIWYDVKPLSTRGDGAGIEWHPGLSQQITSSGKIATTIFGRKTGQARPALRSEKQAAPTSNYLVVNIIDRNGMKVYVNGQEIDHLDFHNIQDEPYFRTGTHLYTNDTFVLCSFTPAEYSLAGVARPKSDSAANASPAASHTLQDKTLVAWVQIKDLRQRGGSVITIADYYPGGGEVFDGLVFGELQPQRWMPGSDFFSRTPSPLTQGSWPTEQAQPNETVQIAAIYRNRNVSIFRNGVLLSTTDVATPMQFSENAEVLIGKRHKHAQPPNCFFAGIIDDVRIYSVALDPSALRELRPNQIQEPNKPFAWWNFEFNAATELTGRFPSSTLEGGAVVSGGRLYLNGDGAVLVASRQTTEARANKVLSINAKP